MCGIMGVSFAPGSTINRHRLAAALLGAGESRGRDASGFAYVSPTSDGVYKKNLPGSKLHVGRIPRDATAIILHTRASTHGSPKDNENNHPVVSPNGSIRLVHNGVIYNHEDVRTVLPKNVQKSLPEVDSSVIGAVIEEYGIDSTSLIAGDAACAWFDYETGNTIHLARFSHSPVNIATLADGSFVFASTAKILAEALSKLGLLWYGSYPEPFETMEGGEYLQIMDGEVIAEGDVEWDDDYSYYSSGKSWRATTSGATTIGAKPSGVTHPAAVKAVSSVSKPMALAPVTKFVEPPAFAKNGVSDAEPLLTEADYDIWVATKELPDDVDTPAYQSRAAEETLLRWANTPAPEYDGYPEYEAYEGLDDPETPDVPMSFFGENDNAVFFTFEHGGDYATYNSLNALTSSLSWMAGLAGSENLLAGPEEGDARWVNHFADIGILSPDQSDEISWLRDQGSLDTFAPFLPSFVKDGISKLRTLVGA